MLYLYVKRGPEGTVLPTVLTCRLSLNFNLFYTLINRTALRGLAGNLSPSRLLSKLSKTDDTEGPTGLVSQEGVLWARMMKREEDPEIQHLQFLRGT